MSNSEGGVPPQEDDLGGGVPSTENSNPEVATPADAEGGVPPVVTPQDGDTPPSDANPFEALPTPQGGDLEAENSTPGQDELPTPPGDELPTPREGEAEVAAPQEGNEIFSGVDASPPPSLQPARISDFGDFVARLNDPSVPLADKVTHLKRIRMTLSKETNPPIDELLQTPDMLDTLVACLRDTRDPEMQFESAWAITNIASGSAEHTRAVTASGAVEIFAQFILDVRNDTSRVNDKLIEQSIWAIGNIVGDGVPQRDAVMASVPDLLPTLVELCYLDSMSPSLKSNTTWTISNFLRGKNASREACMVALPLLVKNVLNESTSDDVLSDSLWALSYYSDGADVRIRDLLSHEGIAMKLTSFLASPKREILHPALRTIGNIVTGTVEDTNTMLKCGILSYVKELIKPNAPRRGNNTVKECCWLLSNITAESPEQIQQVIDAGLVDDLIHHTINGRQPERKECVWALTNLATTGGTEQLKVLLPHVSSLLQVFGSIKHETLEFTSVFLDLAISLGGEFFDVLSNEDMFHLQSVVFIPPTHDSTALSNWRSRCSKISELMERYRAIQDSSVDGQRSLHGVTFTKGF